MLNAKILIQKKKKKKFQSELNVKALNLDLGFCFVVNTADHKSYETEQ